MNRRGAQHAPVAWPPFTFGRNLRPGFELSPRARAGPTAAAAGDEEVGLPGELDRAQRAIVLSDPRLAAHGNSPPTSGF